MLRSYWLSSEEVNLDMDAETCYLMWRFLEVDFQLFVLIAFGGTWVYSGVG